MKSNYKRLGDYIKEITVRNSELQVNNLMGINIDKFFMPSVANIVGTDMTKYKVVKNGQFACNRMHVGRDKRLPVALWKKDDDVIVSPAYTVFEIIDKEVLNPEYLMMWFSRKEFDRNAWFYTDADVRGGLNWKGLCDTPLVIPSISEQEEIVKEYNVLVDRVNLNSCLIQKLEETAKVIYEKWFVEFEFPNENSKPYKSNGGEMFYNSQIEKEIPKGWEVEGLLKLSELRYGKTVSEDRFVDKGYPVFSGYGIRGYYNEYLYEEPQIVVIARGVSGTGEVKMSPPNSYITNLSIVVEVNKDLVNKTYLYYFLKSLNLRSLDSGSAQSQITTKDLGKVAILNPPIELQNNAAKLIGALRNNVDVITEENKILNRTMDIMLSTLAKRSVSYEIH